MLNTFRHNAEKKAFQSYLKSCSAASLAALSEYCERTYGDDSAHLALVNKELERAAERDAANWAYDYGVSYS